MASALLFVAFAGLSRGFGAADPDRVALSVRAGAASAAAAPGIEAAAAQPSARDATTRTILAAAAATDPAAPRTLTDAISSPAPGAPDTYLGAAGPVLSVVAPVEARTLRTGGPPLGGWTPVEHAGPRRIPEQASRARVQRTVWLAIARTLDGARTGDLSFHVSAIPPPSETSRV